MNLFQRIIAWLATRFLSKYNVQDLFIDKVLMGNNEALVLRGLFARYNSLDDVRSSAPGKNLNMVTLDHLLYTFTVGELAKLLFYKTIKEQVRVCVSTDCHDTEELFKKLASNVATNPMKRLATFKMILRDNLHDLTEDEISLLANIALTVNTANFEANSSFLETI